MALLSPMIPSDAGTTVTNLTGVAASAGGDTFAPGDHVVLIVTNASGGAITVTFDSVAPSNYGTDENTGGSVPSLGAKIFGPFPANRFANATTGLVSVTYSGVTALTVAVYSC